jgi:glycosyltransferase involved in cell wall biosynthesis
VGEPLIPVEPLRRRAAALGVSGNITWDLRYVSDADMADVFRRADIFAFPYREIDTSGVLMSCLPFGKPIIATRIGAFAARLTDGVHGRLVPRDDPDALAAAVAALAGDPKYREICGRAVAALVDAIPGWNDIALQTLALYRNVQRQSATAQAN